MPLETPTQTSVVNNALSELGATERLTSINDIGNTGTRARSFWAPTLRQMLARHPWNFAVRRAVLNATDAEPASRYARRFALPIDCLRWLPYAPRERDYRIAEREGRYLLSDAEAPFPCRYIALIEDVSAWSPGFVVAMELAMAARMAEGVTQAENIKQDLLARAKKALADAKRDDGLESGSTDRSVGRRQSSWVRARNRSAYSRDCN